MICMQSLSMQIESICERIIAEVLQAKQSLISSVTLHPKHILSYNADQLTEQRDVKLQSFATQHRQLQDTVPILQVRTCRLERLSIDATRPQWRSARHLAKYQTRFVALICL